MTLRQCRSEEDGRKGMRGGVKEGGNGGEGEVRS
jgi:hypothetical protein